MGRTIFQIYINVRPLLIAVALLLFIFINIFPSLQKHPNLRLQILYNGALLLGLFLTTTIASAIIFTFICIFAGAGIKWLLIYAAIITLLESVLFWNGIIRVYSTSLQLGIKWRVIGIICGIIPVVHIIVLLKIIKIAKKEVLFEEEKIVVDAKRNNEHICKTKYPILLVHGVFFRDSRFFNYWGRIPAALISNGATVYYGQQESAASVEDSAAQLANKIKDICQTTGCKKVNIIAHSKGGLDARYAISQLGINHLVATLTTINTPHRGCVFAEYLLNKVPEKLRNSLANTYNKTLRKLGEKQPDFLAAVSDLTASKCEDFNNKTPNMDDVYYQSVGSILKRATSGKFPLNFSYYLVKYFDGGNDGLVSLSSAKWGENFIELTPYGNRGISHGDMIDLNRENICGFDVREFYVNLVNGLKNKGF